MLAERIRIEVGIVKRFVGRDTGELDEARRLTCGLGAEQTAGIEFADFAGDAHW